MFSRGDEGIDADHAGNAPPAFGKDRRTIGKAKPFLRPCMCGHLALGAKTKLARGQPPSQPRRHRNTVGIARKGGGVRARMASRCWVCHPSPTGRTGWTQAGHGGLYQAVADGTYQTCGLDVTIMPGGPQVNHQALTPAGRIGFYMGGTLDAPFGVQQGRPLVNRLKG